MATITEQKGLWYKIEGDERWHFDGNLAQKLRQQVPNYWEDECPSCGNRENISGCRCLENHRTCPICGARWYWKLNKQLARMDVIIEKIGTLTLDKKL